MNLYNYANLFPLLGTNDADVLEPLKERYVSQHYALRKFYYECSNLKYLTSLINVPKLGHVCILNIFNTSPPYSRPRNHQICWILVMHQIYPPDRKQPRNLLPLHLLRHNQVLLKLTSKLGCLKNTKTSKQL